MSKIDNKKILITGISGQTGSFIAEELVGKGCEVHGLVRKVSHMGQLANLENIKGKITLHTGSLASADNLISILAKVKPDFIFNCAAQSHVATSYDMPTETADINYLGWLRLLEAARIVCPQARLLTCSTSEMFGFAPAPQGEDTPFAPSSTYSIAKIASYYQTIHHRNAHNMFVSQSICFNHESPRRPETFVTRKITKSCARIKLGMQDKLILGNLDTARDWGYAKEYASAIIKILEHDEPTEFVIGTGVCTKLREFLELSFSYFGLDWTKYVEQDEKFMRPLDHIELRANFSKAELLLGWKPKTTIKELVEIMCNNDFKLAEKEKNSLL